MTANASPGPPCPWLGKSLLESTSLSYARLFAAGSGLARKCARCIYAGHQFRPAQAVGPSSSSLRSFARKLGRGYACVMCCLAHHPVLVSFNIVIVTVIGQHSADFEAATDFTFACRSVDSSCAFSAGRLDLLTNLGCLAHPALESMGSLDVDNCFERWGSGSATRICSEQSFGSSLGSQRRRYSALALVSYPDSHCCFLGMLCSSACSSTSHYYSCIPCCYFEIGIC